MFLYMSKHAYMLFQYFLIRILRNRIIRSTLNGLRVPAFFHMIEQHENFGFRRKHLYLLHKSSRIIFTHCAVKQNDINSLSGNLCCRIVPVPAHKSDLEPGNLIQHRLEAFTVDVV